MDKNWRNFAGNVQRLNGENMFAGSWRKPQKSQKKAFMKCLLCNVQFATKKTLTLHHKSHMPVTRNSWLCSICEVNLPSSKALNLHKKAHTEENRFDSEPYKSPLYECALCSVGSKSPRSLVLHFLDAHPDQHAAWISPKATKKKSDCADKTPPVLCDENQNEIQPKCNKYKKNLVELNTVCCPFCHLSFGGNRLKGHLMTQHALNRYLYCTHCAEILGNRLEMENHMIDHTQGTPPLRCTSCDALFVSAEAVEAHSRLHTSKRPFPCTVCWREFSTKTGVIAHFHGHLRVDNLTAPAKILNTSMLSPRTYNPMVIQTL